MVKYIFDDNDSVDFDIISFLSDYEEDIEDNSNSGMMTKIWGPGLWVGMHTISFGYPVEPNEEQKRYYKNFYTVIGDILPCSYCRDSYKQFISTKPTELNDDVMKNRKSLTKWLYNLHNRVNEKLGIDYDLTYEDVAKRYESYRASCVKTDRNVKGCTTPLSIKSKSFIRAAIKDCPVIGIEQASQFIEYCRKRGISEEEISLMKHYNRFRKDKNSTEWIKRNIECEKITNKMRYYNIPSKEIEGEFKNLQTINELRLICRLSTNLCQDELLNMTKILSSQTVQAGGKKNIISGYRRIKKYVIKKID